jgi:hypothetical protein
MEKLIVDTKKDLDIMTKCLKDLGMKGNESKTEKRVFNRMDFAQYHLTSTRLK